MNNPFDYRPDAECEEAFERLIAEVEALKKSDRQEDVNFCRELEDGKMLGVLIADDGSGVRHTLYAFSGQLGEGGFHHEGFVGPVFDYLQPNGYFKIKEREISCQNLEIREFEEGDYAKAKSDLQIAKEKLDAEVAEYKEKCRLSKEERKVKRESGMMNEAENAAMVRQSQFEKAELHRLKIRVASALEPLVAEFKDAQSRLDAMKEKRRSDSEALQKWLFSNFKLLNARGESRSLSDIFAETPMRIPPSGAGECCAPKLLQAAYLRGWHPVSIAEYWYGRSKEGEVRVHGQYYPACRGKCLPVLGWMLKGLDIVPPLGTEDFPAVIHEPKIIYENQWFCVVEKPSGMLSVPGKGASLSVQQWLQDKYGPDRHVKMAHRLDQDTSGLIIATFGEQSFKVMQSLFATRNVRKTYVAELDGNFESRDIPRQGRICLPLSPDWFDRPRQKIDWETGKEAVTDYEFTGVSAGHSRVIFHPLTGRTHQLRVHAASGEGLGMSIVGDRLYGNNKEGKAQRLHLHAHKIEFLFPLDSNRYSFESPVSFISEDGNA